MTHHQLLAQADRPAPSPSSADTLTKLKQEFLGMWEATLAFTPKLALALALLIIGLIFAKIVRFLIRSVTQKIALDAAAEKIGLSQLLAKASINASIPIILSTVVYWVLLLGVLKLVVAALNIAELSSALNVVFAFLPKLFTALLILMGGLLVGDLIKNVIQTGMKQFDIDYATVTANLVYGLIVVMTLTVVLGQLQIQTELLNAVVKIMVGGMVGAIALALGLGLKNLATQILSGVYVRDVFKEGTKVEIEGELAKIEETSSVATKLRKPDGSFVVVPNSDLIGETRKGEDAD